MITTRTSGLSRSSVSALPSPSHISSDIALRFSGLLKVMTPTPSLTLCRILPSAKDFSLVVGTSRIGRVPVRVQEVTEIRAPAVVPRFDDPGQGAESGPDHALAHEALRSVAASGVGTSPMGRGRRVAPGEGGGLSWDHNPSPGLLRNPT